MTAKRFYRNKGTIWENDKSLSLGDVEDRLNELHEENQKCKEYNAILYSNTAKNEKELLKENEQLKIALKDKENLISICEKKFKELGYLITCDDDGYVIE
jgi:hypothetical protein